MATISFILSKNTSEVYGRVPIRERKYWVLIIENFMNDLFHCRGQVAINTVLEYLGLSKVEGGDTYGWNKEYGDEYIDFGFLDDVYKRFRNDPNYNLDEVELTLNCLCSPINDKGLPWLVFEHLEEKERPANENE